MTSSTAVTENPENNVPSTIKTWGKRVLTVAFFILIAGLLYNLLHSIEWNDVSEALTQYTWRHLALGVLITMTSYGIFASYDLLGKKYTDHKLPVKQIIPLGVVCYAFNLNLSAWVGGIALRYRLYHRLGLKTATITRVLSISLISNWLGYIILAGTIFTLRLLDLPDNWKIGTTALQFIGITLLFIACAYFFACKFSTRRVFHIRKHEIELPSFPFALVQASLAIVNWSLMGLLLFILMPDKATYPTVLGILLICSIAGIITHIPAGLGVLEAIFITMLQGQLAKSSILAALIAYRILYFLIPLALATIIYIAMEIRAKKMKQQNTEQSL
jgi:glycosyltransferase 2 family protein